LVLFIFQNEKVKLGNIEKLEGIIFIIIENKPAF